MVEFEDPHKVAYTELGGEVTSHILRGCAQDEAVASLAPVDGHGQGCQHLLKIQQVLLGLLVQSPEISIG